MSTIAEIAEREAQEAEAEFPDPPDGDQAEAENGDQAEPVDIISGAKLLDDAPEPKPSPSDQDAEKVWKQIETKVANFKKGIAPLLEETGLPFMESPFDVLPGYVLPYDANNPEALGLKIAADAYFDAGTPELKPHPTMVTCPECDGFGRMSNGAKGDNTPWALCWSCHGSGSRDLTMPPPSPPVAFGQPAPVAPLAAVPAWQPQPSVAAPASERLDPPHGWHASGSPGADQWARWPGHPRFGIDPALSGW